MAQEVFERIEKKYLLPETVFRRLLPELRKHMADDVYGRYTISNIYFDTEQFDLIRASLEKPVYKEKLRIRSYGTAQGSDNVFVEIKKKYDGVVYKRRIVLPADEAAEYLKTGTLKEPSQISREIDWMRPRLDLKPRVFIGYDREAYAGAKGVENPDLRITFDTNLRYRDDHLDLREGDGGSALLEDGTVLMEIKIPGTAPLWLARLLSENDIHMTSFSKYGTYYKNVVLGRSTENRQGDTKLCSLPSWTRSLPAAR